MEDEGERSRTGEKKGMFNKLKPVHSKSKCKHSTGNNSAEGEGRPGSPPQTQYFFFCRSRRRRRKQWGYRGRGPEKAAAKKGGLHALGVLGGKIFPGYVRKSFPFEPSKDGVEKRSRCGRGKGGGKHPSLSTRPRRNVGSAKGGQRDWDITRVRKGLPSVGDSMYTFASRRLELAGMEV